MALFKDVYDKNHRPTVADLQNYWPKDVGELFREFADHLLEEYSLSFAIPTWTEKKGWIYRLGRSGVYLISGITIEEDGFTVMGHTVRNRVSYESMFLAVKSCYESEKDSFLAKIAEKNHNQAERSKARVMREAKEKELLASRIKPEKYNRFRWPEKININRLRQLYRNDASGFKDEELADDIGLCLYLRCKYGKEDMLLLDKYQLRCHHCDAILGGFEDFRECSCGYQYSYKEYRRNYRRNNMPTGAAAKVFDEFIEKWPQQRDYTDKMRAIDTLLHEFHLNLVSGAVHRPVAMNFMDGTREQIEKIINELAYQ